MGQWVAVHRKGILGALAALGAVCAALAGYTDLGPVAKWAGAVVAVLAAAGVYRVPNAKQIPVEAEAKPAAFFDARDQAVIESHAADQTGPAAKPSRRLPRHRVVPPSGPLDDPPPERPG